MQTRLAGALFDLDGVLVDSRLPIARSIQFALARHDLAPVAECDLHALIGSPLHDALGTLLRAQSADLRLVDSCVAAYRECYAAASLAHTTPMPGIEPVLSALASHLPLAVATSKPVEFARPILEMVGLAGAFHAIVGPPLSARSEPKTQTVARALEVLRPASRGAPASARGVIVGDRHHDVEAGLAHRLVTIGVTWGIGSREELVGAGVDHLVDTPRELLSLLVEPQNSSSRRRPSALESAVEAASVGSVPSRNAWK
jgi:phosphoglycolate phosphatase